MAHRPLGYLACHHCGMPHLDLGAIPHRAHRCSRCSRLFCEPTPGLGSPLMLLRPRWFQGQLRWGVLEGGLAVVCLVEVRGERVRL